MVQLGIGLMILGGGSFLLNMAGMEFRLLQWIEAWGPGTGVGIRIGFIALGAVILVAANASAGNNNNDKSEW